MCPTVMSLWTLGWEGWGSPIAGCESVISIGQQQVYKMLLTGCGTGFGLVYLFEV